MYVFGEPLGDWIKLFFVMVIMAHVLGCLIASSIFKALDLVRPLAQWVMAEARHQHRGVTDSAGRISSSYRQHMAKAKADWVVGQFKDAMTKVAADHAGGNRYSGEIWDKVFPNEREML